MRSTTDDVMSEPRRPHVTAYFAEPDKNGSPLLLAIGRAVLGVAGLEKMLLAEIARLLVERHGGGDEARRERASKELARLERLPAGQLLAELRGLELARELDERIGDVIERRNWLVHHLVEDPVIAKAVAGEEIEPAVEQVEQLALDAAALAVELHAVAGTRLAAAIGKSPAELLKIMKSVDPATIEDPDERRQLEAIQAFDDLDVDVLSLGDDADSE
jgi:hypothetical protein